jgi:TP901 family phage tail tape measure protein
MSDLRTSIVLSLTGNLEARARRYGSAVGQFAGGAERQLGRVSRSAAALGRGLDALGNKYTGMLAGAGAAYKATQAAMASAALDKQLTRVRQTAGASREAARLLRIELHRLARETGQSLDDLLGGFNNLVQAGQGWEQALATIRATNAAMAVTGASADVLSSGLTVAAEAFNFDLSAPETAALLLDKMTVAGRAGNAELEDLAGIFARVGVNAKGAGLSFDEALGFIEQLSLVERAPERLATLADSTLRLFTNQRYLRAAAKATRVSFYDADGQRRAAFAVLDDIATKYKTLGSDRARDNFIDRAFGETDLDTKKGLMKLLGGDELANVRTVTQEIAGASGTLGRDMAEAVDNAVDQVARLKAALWDAADAFAQPVNEVIRDGIKQLLDNHKLGGKELLLGGVAAGAAGFGALKLGGRMLAGVGKTLAKATGLGGLPVPLPVYVVNSRMSLLPGEYGGGYAGGAAGGAKGGRSTLGKRGGRVGRMLARFGGMGRYAGRLGGAASIVAAGVGLADVLTDDSLSGEEQTTAAGGYAGGAAGGALGGWGGAALGAAIGTAILPGIGTAVGGALGGLAGSLAGFLGGEWGGSKFGEWLAGGKGAAPEPAQASVLVSISDDRVRVKRMEAQGMDLDVDTGVVLGGVGR